MSRETQLAKRKKEKNIFENIPEGGYLGQLARKLKIKARKEKQTGTKFERRQKSIKKGTNQRTEINNKRKLEKLKEKNARGRTTSTKKKSLSNIPVQERSAPVNKKARGLSSLGADYAKQEKKFSKKAKEESKKTYAKRFPKMGTYKNAKGESVANEKLKVKKGKSSIEQKNRDRFGDAHVDKLKQKNADFQKMKKKQMSKAEFIKKYPKSITAQKAKGLRK